MQLWVIKRILSDEKRDGEAIRFMANIGWPHVFLHDITDDYASRRCPSQKSLCCKIKP